MHGMKNTCKPTIIAAVISFFLLAGLNSCVKDKFDDTPLEDTQNDDSTNGATPMSELQVPADFEFETSETVSVTINDSDPNAIYTIYAYNDQQFNLQDIDVINDDGQEDIDTTFETDILNQVLFTGSAVNGRLEYLVNTPTYYTKYYVRRKSGNLFSSQIIDIIDGAATYTHIDTAGQSRQAVVQRFKSSARLHSSRARGIEIDSLYCVNGSGQLFTVNPLNGHLTELAAMPQGSWTAAIDHTNLYLYSIGKSNPYPLMRYDMTNDSWSTIGNVGMGGPRLDYREQDGLLYFSTGAKVYTIDPTNAAVLSTWDINNLDVTNGGDLIFAEDGTLFLSSFGGLYRLDPGNNNDYNAVRISADNLPFTPTSMTFDSNNELWLASNGGSSDLIIMDTVTGGWEYVYGPNSTSGVDFGRTINDLTTYTVTDEEAIDPDTDGDGIKDSEDKFPDDPEAAFEQYTPSRYGWGTLAFEDLWPFQADYDMNDTSVNYRFVAVLNASNQVVRLEINYEVTSDGSGLTNGVGIELENILPSQVESVTGSILRNNYITLAGNGLEANQDNAVVILFDDNEGLVNVPKQLVIKFTNPLTTAELGSAPFNPFLMVGRDRAHEIHLPNRARTSLGQLIVPEQGVNADPDGDFETDNGLPWAIDIIHNFRVPKEKVPVNQAYNFFEQWATSGGSQFGDWYKDNPGYRNVNKLKASGVQ